jgi:hypothetical protein
MFDDKSRYAGAPLYEVPGPRGIRVAVVSVPDVVHEALLGAHLRKDGQRLDHLASHYLDDPAGFWRLCDRNDAMHAEALTEAREIEIPRGSR